MDKCATDGQPGTLFEGEGIQYLLYSPVEGLLDITTKFITDTVVSVLTHTCRWTPKSMGYHRVLVLAEFVPGPFFGSYNAGLCFK